MINLVDEMHQVEVIPRAKARGQGAMVGQAEEAGRGEGRIK